MKNKDTFDTVDQDGNPIKLAVLRPTAKQNQKANIIASQTFGELIDKCILRSQLEDVLRAKGIWDDTQQKELENLQAKLIVNERKLLAGGIKKSEGKAIAIEMWADRAEIRRLLSERNSLDSMTVEGQCENAKFNYLVAVCTVYNDTGKLYFDSYEDYLTRSDEIAATQAAIHLMQIVYDVDNDINASLPENKFLKEYGYINEKYQLINKDGKLVDLGGRLIDEDGRYINEAGEFINLKGERVDKEGNPFVERKPFLDDDEAPITVEEKPKKTKKTKVS